jgi:Methyltransferase domain
VPGLLDDVHARYVPRALPYFDLLDRIHQHLRPRTYAEIGVSTGRSMTLALPGTICVGIDPEPKVQFHLGRRTQVFAETSDDFFAEHDLKALLGGRPLDLAFIDGMHHFEFALRDFVNFERCSNPSTTVLIHDCLPVDEVTAARERTTDFWSGDVWRLILLLRRWRPELEVAVVDWGPTGVGVVRGLDPSSTVLTDDYDRIVSEYLATPYASLDDGSKRAQLNVVPGEWGVVRRLLPDRPFRHANLALLKAQRAIEARRFAHRQRRAAAPG